MDTLKLLRIANANRQKEWDPDSSIDVMFRAIELWGESGEVGNKIKKLERERRGIRGSRATVDELAEELADTVICSDLIAMDYDIDLARAVARKFNQTSMSNGLKTRMHDESGIKARGDGIFQWWFDGGKHPEIYTNGPYDTYEEAVQVLKNELDESYGLATLIEADKKLLQPEFAVSRAVEEICNSLVESNYEAFNDYQQTDGWDLEQMESLEHLLELTVAHWLRANPLPDVWAFGTTRSEEIWAWDNNGWGKVDAP